MPLNHFSLAVYWPQKYIEQHTNFCFMLYLNFPTFILISCAFTDFFKDSSVFILHFNFLLYCYPTCKLMLQAVKCFCLIYRKFHGHPHRCCSNCSCCDCCDCCDRINCLQEKKWVAKTGGKITFLKTQSHSFLKIWTGRWCEKLYNV